MSQSPLAVTIDNNPLWAILEYTNIHLCFYIFSGGEPLKNQNSGHYHPESNMDLLVLKHSGYIINTLVLYDQNIKNC